MKGARIETAVTLRLADARGNERRPSRVRKGVRSLNEIRREIDRASARRAELWEELAEGYDPASSAEAARLTKRIEELWAETRTARARSRYGPSDEIITRARAEDRLDREARRWRNAA